MLSQTTIRLLNNSSHQNTPGYDFLVNSHFKIKLKHFYLANFLKIKAYERYITSPDSINNV